MKIFILKLDPLVRNKIFWAKKTEFLALLRAVLAVKRDVIV